MLGFPNAKINIGLNIVSKRPDGYHNLETIFFPVKLADVLEFNEAPTTRMTISGLQIDADSNDNLVMKAYHLLKDKYSLPPLHFHLHKIIPFGAGLGGGSSDAAFTLKMLNDHFKLGISENELVKFASQIGADCPFFIKNQPAFAEGIGDQLKPIEINLEQYRIILLKPNFSISTPEAYRNVIPRKPSYNLSEIADLPVEKWKDSVVNDFEDALFPSYPILQELKDLLYSAGAVYASMSGSGSALYGIFKESPELKGLIPPEVSIYY